MIWMVGVKEVTRGILLHQPRHQSRYVIRGCIQDNTDEILLRPHWSDSMRGPITGESRLLKLLLCLHTALNLRRQLLMSVDRSDGSCMFLVFLIHHPWRTEYRHLFSNHKRIHILFVFLLRHYFQKPGPFLLLFVRLRSKIDWNFRCGIKFGILRHTFEGHIIRTWQWWFYKFNPIKTIQLNGLINIHLAERMIIVSILISLFLNSILKQLCVSGFECDSTVVKKSSFFSRANSITWLPKCGALKA
jgi:hypothetical protein